jgi:hypothetical protein
LLGGDATQRGLFVMNQRGRGSGRLPTFSGSPAARNRVRSSPVPAFSSTWELVGRHLVPCAPPTLQPDVVVEGLFGEFETARHGQVVENESRANQPLNAKRA